MYFRFAFPQVTARGGNNQSPQDNDLDGVPVSGTGALANGIARGLVVAVGGTLGTITGTTTDGSTFSVALATNTPLRLDVASITSLGAATNVYALY